MTAPKKQNLLLCLKYLKNLQATSQKPTAVISHFSFVEKNSLT